MDVICDVASITASHSTEGVFMSQSNQQTHQTELIILILPFILAYKPTIFGTILTFKLCGRLIRGSCHTARVDSQHDGYLSATLTVCGRGPLVGH